MRVLPVILLLILLALVLTSEAQQNQRNQTQQGKSRRRPNKCLDKPKRGSCKSLIVRWFFNSLKGLCEYFIWGGCRRRNNNNFKTRGQCRQTCLLG